MSTVTPGLDGGSLIVVSNREPYEHEYDDEPDGDRSITVDRPAGGLTAGLDPVVQRTEGTWIAWGSGEADREATDEDGTVRMPPEDPAYTLKRIWLSEDEVEGYYYGYSNRVLWPLCHGGVWQTDFAERHWQRYRQVNETFAEAVAERADADSLVWFQDYHFALAPRMVRESVPDAFLMQFWHITWPGWDTFRACPQATELLEGLLGNDLLGFHVDRYVENFLDCVDEGLEDAFVDREGGRVNYRDHTTTVRAFPMGVDVESVRSDAEAVDPEFWTEFKRDHRIPADAEVALGVDRLDYTKGIPERLAALERFWEMNEDWRGEVSYVQKATESRSLIPEYQDLQAEVYEAVEHINDRFGTDDWQPVVYLDEFLPQEQLTGLYRYSDVMLVSAVRDGMNLVAKEYVAAQSLEPTAEGTNPGILVLSDQTGAFEELGEDAVVINPYDTDQFANGIETALTMPSDERRERMERLQTVVDDNDLFAWMDAVFDAARELRTDEADPDGDES